MRLLKFNDHRIVIADYIEVSAEQMLSAVREQRLEGIVGKRRDSVYEPGKRSGAWITHRVNLGQEFVIWRLYSRPARCRRDHCGVLPGRTVDMRRADAKRIRPRLTSPGV